MLLAGLLCSAVPSPATADEQAAGLAVLDPTFAPLFAGRTVGTILQRRQSPGAALRLEPRRSLEFTTDVGGRRLLRLDRFGRGVERDLRAALRAADADVVLDLRHNGGGLLRRMLAVAGRFTGPVEGAVRLVDEDRVVELEIPAPSGEIWQGPLTVLVGGLTISSGEVLAALLRQHAGATVLGERTFGKDHVLRVEIIDPDWRALVPAGRLEVPGEGLAGGLRPDGPIPDELAGRQATR